MGAPVIGASAVELEDIQGLVKSAYRTLPHARYLLFTVGPAEGGRRVLAQLAQLVTPASDREVGLATQVALSCTGLRRIGLPDDVIEGFSAEFVSGMAAAERSRFLGDLPEDWEWGGPGQAPADLFVAMFAADSSGLENAVQELLATAHAGGLTTIVDLPVPGLSDAEPFGFRDGVSQPFVRELASTEQRSATSEPRATPVGEFVLGYPNIYGLLTQRPVLPAARDPQRVLPRLAPGDDSGAADGGADLGRNGTYLVVRTLEQDTAGFESWVTTAAAEAGLPSELLAAKMVGRWRSGAPLTQSPDRDRPELATSNDFGYHRDDADGRRCPIGAHVRRANPRDSLDPRPGSARSLEVTDRHRLIRRGRSFQGPDRQGLQFIAVNANIGRQFEFVQHSWLNNPKFGGLYDDVDPLLSPRGPTSVFTIPASPLRQRLKALPDFVTVRGGAYFFMPGLRALRYLASGSW